MAIVEQRYLGRPKAVMLTHGNLRYYQQAVLTVMPLAEQSGDDGTTRLVSYRRWRTSPAGPPTTGGR